MPVTTRELVAALRTTVETYHDAHHDQQTGQYCAICQLLRAANEYAARERIIHAIPTEVTLFDAVLLDRGAA